MNTNGNFDRYLKRAGSTVAIALGVLCCILIWRMTKIAGRMETMLANTSSDVQQVAGTAADISRRIEHISAKVDDLEDKARSAVNLDEVESVLDEIGRLRANDEAAELSPSAEVEIKRLLKSIRRSGKRFEWEGKTRTPTQCYIWLYSKFRMYRKKLESADDFINKVATKTMTGNPYYVVHSDGEQQPLNEWLSEVLAKHRQQDNS